MILYLYTSLNLIIIMLKALKISRLTFPLQQLATIRIHSNFRISFSQQLVFGFTQEKSGLPRNKEEAFRMQEQLKLQSKPQDSQQQKVYKGVRPYGLLGLFMMVGSLIYLNHYAEKTSEEQLSFYEEEQISGLKQEKVEKNEIGGDWTLIDSEGQPFSSRMLSGYYYLIYFGYANSPDVCPSTLYYLSTVYRVIRNLPEGAYLKLKVVFVSIDPERDTPNALKAYLSNFHKVMIGVTGSLGNELQLKGCLKKFRIKVKKVQKGQNKNKYSFDYNTQIYLMDPDNKYLYHIDPSLTEQQAAKAVVAKIISNEHKKQKKLEATGS